MNLSEWILSSILIATLLLFLYFKFKEKVDNDEDSVDRYSLNYLCEEMKRIINNIINMDLTVLNLNQKDLENRKALKRSLSDAVRKCSQGDLHAKMIVFARVKNILTNALGITTEVIDYVIPFNKPDRLTPTDKFEIMYYLQKREGSNKILREICKTTDLGRLKKDKRGYYYDVTEEDINDAYDKIGASLSFDDKLNILTQRVYQETYGLSCVDMMIMEDESLDSVSGGLIGITTENFRFQEEILFKGEHRRARTFESIVLIYSGKPIHFKFLAFKSNAELMRICKNISEYSRTGHITSSEGGIKARLANGSRVTVFRPNNASQWAFFVRKYGSAPSNNLKDLITHKGCQYPIDVIKWGVKGCLNLTLSGDANSGKTTFSRAIVGEFDRRQPTRSIEADFELYLNDAYYDMNILGTRPSERLPYPKLIELLKASDAHTIIFGEIASLEQAKHSIDLMLAGTKRIVQTGHWPTSDELVSYFVHAMGGYGNGGTQELEAMIARRLHIDIHCVKENNGDRYIDRITEIIPYNLDEEPIVENTIEGKLDKIAYYLKAIARKKTYYTRDIVVFKDGEYHMVQPFSERLTEIILSNLPPEERTAFLEFNRVIERSADIA